MGDSWEDQQGAGAPKLNVGAKPFVFNPGARSFTPGGGGRGATTEDMTAQMAAASIADPAASSSSVMEEDDEGDDENDPLWQAVFKMAGGDRAKTEKMLEDPDSLMQYPEIRALLEGVEGGGEGSTTAAMDAELSRKAEPRMPVATAAAPASSSSSISSSKMSSGSSPLVAAAEDDDDAGGSSELQDEDPREHLNLVFIGHVDAGKSTMSGQLLYLTGQVDKRTIERFEKEAKQLNRESWFLAFIMDTNEEERAKGKTVEVGRAHFDTDAKRYTIMDAPGHKNYVPNMIAGAVQADVGILVISARRGEFETGFERGGQTREHALLAKTLGVRYLVVVINKMDDSTVKWSKDRFDECVSKLKPFLKSCGYAPKKDVKFIPVSGLTGDNIQKPVAASTCPWWEGLYVAGEHNTAEPTLISCLDALCIEGREPSAPLRIPVLDRYQDRGTISLGKVESGSVKVGQKVLVMPTKNTYEVQSILINDLPVRSAKPGENVKVKLGGAAVEDVQKGYVLCSVGEPCHAATRFDCQLALVDLLEHRPIFSPGYTCVAHLHTAEEEVTVMDLLSIEDRKSGEVKKKPRFARQGNVITCRMRTKREVCCEAFKEMAQLGRLTLRDEGKTIAIGKILTVLPGKVAK
ncbi:elongation factor tu [Nannochloropsis oceanica]